MTAVLSSPVTDTAASNEANIENTFGNEKAHLALFMQYSIYKPMLWPVVAHIAVLLIPGVKKITSNGILTDSGVSIKIFTLFGETAQK